jgi:hypothetical protein
MKKHGLPTFPVFDGMDIGEREDDELLWLLSHGYFISSPIAFYKKIERQRGEFVLLSGSNERHLAGHEEELGRFPTLEKLLKSKKFGDFRLGRWQWFGDKQEKQS